MDSGKKMTAKGFNSVSDWHEGEIRRVTIVGDIQVRPMLFGTLQLHGRSENITPLPPGLHVNFQQRVEYKISQLVLNLKCQDDLG